MRHCWIAVVSGIINSIADLAAQRVSRVVTLCTRRANGEQVVCVICIRCLLQVHHSIYTIWANDASKYTVYIYTNQWLSNLFLSAPNKLYLYLFICTILVFLLWRYLQSPPSDQKNNSTITIFNYVLEKFILLRKSKRESRRELCL